MTPVNLLNRFTELLHASLTRYAGGDEVKFAASMALVQQSEGMTPVFAVSVSIPHLALGQTVQTFTILPLEDYDKEAVQEMARSSLESLRNERSKTVHELNGSSSPVPPSGLILP